MMDSVREEKSFRRRNAEKRSINVGCGNDSWGDVRLDIAPAYLGRLSSANIYGDAQNLPFRKDSFGELRASNILEHLPRWREAIKEWCRVSNSIDIVVPVDSDLLNKEVYLEILSGYLGGLLRIQSRRREHLWRFKPCEITEELKAHGFSATASNISGPMLFNRDTRLLRVWLFEYLRRKSGKTITHVKINAKKTKIVRRPSTTHL